MKTTPTDPASLAKEEVAAYREMARDAKADGDHVLSAAYRKLAKNAQAKVRKLNKETK